MGIKKTVKTSSGISTVTAEGLAFLDNRITGITSTTDANDVASKSYALSQLPDLNLAANAGKFYTTTDGINTSWDFVSNSQEFTTPGAQTFTLPPQANLLLVEAVGGGSGGSAGNNNSSLSDWVFYTSSLIPGNMNTVTYSNTRNEILIGANQGWVATSTDAINWIEGRPVLFDIWDATFSGNLYHIVGASGNLSVSTDAIAWTFRTSGFGSSIIYAIYANTAGTFFVMGGAGGIIRTSTDAIAWTSRTSVFTSNIFDINFGNSLYLASGASNRLATSTDTIHWTSRTTFPGGASSILEVAFSPVATERYAAVQGSTSGLVTSTNGIQWTLRTVSAFNTVTYGNGFYVAGRGVGRVVYSTDGISWLSNNITDSTGANSINAIGYNSINNIWVCGFENSGGSTFIGTSYSRISGYGAGGGAYVSWYIPRNIINSNITVNPGAGGIGGSSAGGAGTSGSNTTITWTGPNATTYTLTARGDGTANTASSSSSFYASSGGSISIQKRLPPSSGTSANNQINKFQPTGGGNGALDSGTGGNGGSTFYYGNTIAGGAGGTAGNPGSNAAAITGLPNGTGGGGGGASVSAAGNGGNGVRGGGGGGGAANATTFGNGGNGGDGYVKITWW